MKRNVLRTVLLGGAAALSLTLAACGDGHSTPTDNGTAPQTTSDGRGAPDVNGNNRDQPLSTTPVAAAATNAVP